MTMSIDKAVSATRNISKSNRITILKTEVETNQNKKWDKLKDISYNPAKCGMLTALTNGPYVGASAGLISILCDLVREYEFLFGGSSSDNEPEEFCIETEFPLSIAINNFQNKTVMIGGRNVSSKEWPGGGYYKNCRNKFHEFDRSEIKIGSFILKISFPNFDVNVPDKPNGLQIIHLELNIECKNADDPTKQRNIYIVRKYKYSGVTKHFNPGTIGHLNLYDVL
jgi:hypothetical protein